MHSCFPRLQLRFRASASFGAKRFAFALALLLMTAMLACTSALGQSTQSGRKPTRAAAPKFDDSAFSGVFFKDAASLLKGEIPSGQAQATASNAGLATATNGSGAASGTATGGTATAHAKSDTDADSWDALISPTSLEDLIKGSKLRLDRIVTTPSAFAGGGYADARKEFSLQALLFAIIEHYAGEVRWKQSAALARETLARAAANSKVGSIQSYNEAKQRLLDLGDLVNGSQLAGEAKTDAEWDKLIDRSPLMQLLEWAQQDYIAPFSASESSFQANAAELKRYAELVAVLGRTSILKDMPDAADDDYVAFANDMIQQAAKLKLAVDTNSAEMARAAASAMGQSCTNCHDNFR